MGAVTEVTRQRMKTWNRQVHTLLIPDSRGPGAGAAQAAGHFSQENQGDCCWPLVQVGWTVRWCDGFSGPAAPAASQLLVYSSQEGTGTPATGTPAEHLPGAGAVRSQLLGGSPAHTYLRGPASWRWLVPPPVHLAPGRPPSSAWQNSRSKTSTQLLGEGARG